MYRPKAIISPRPIRPVHFSTLSLRFFAVLKAAADTKP